MKFAKCILLFLTVICITNEKCEAMKNLTLVHSQRNDSCIICGEEFKPRAGKQYCSPACKQKGYENNKQQIEEQREKERERKIAEKQFVVYFPEYQEYNKKYPNTNLKEFLLYCFFRKNWIGKFDVDKFHQYRNSFDDYFWDEFWDNNGTGDVSPARKKYNEFSEKFFSNDVQISFQNE